LTDSNLNRAIGVLMGKVDAIGEQLVETRTDMRMAQEKSDVSRANVHRRLDEITGRTQHLEHTSMSHAETLRGIEASVADVRLVTDDVKMMRAQAEGAGTLGRWLIKIGITVLACAGWIVSAYTYLTGRPPP